MSAKDATLFYSGYSGVAHSDISSFLGKTLSAQEQAVCTSFIKSVEEHIARQCQKNFLSTENNVDVVYEEVFDGGAEEYGLFNYPVKEVTKITVDGVVYYEKDGANNSWVLNEDFYVYPYKVRFDIDTESEPRSIKIEHSIKKFWGDDVKMGIIMWIAEIIGARKYGGRDVASANINGIALSFNTQKLPQYISDLIARYRKYAI